MEAWSLGGGLGETCEEKKRRVGEPERVCGITSTQKRARPRQQMFELCEVAKPLYMTRTREKHNTIIQSKITKVANLDHCDATGSPSIHCEIFFCTGEGSMLK